MKQVEEVSGTRLKIIHPSKAIDAFSCGGIPGGIGVELAKFGRFQTGTSI